MKSTFTRQRYALSFRRASTLSLALVALGLSGCPGKLDNLQQFIGGGEGGVPTCNIPGASVELQLIRPRCASGGCHNRADHAADLDLVSPGIAQRLIDRPSSCMNKPLINGAMRDQSYLLEKLGSSPGCGRQMPLGAPAFTADELACARVWVNSLNPDNIPDGGVMDVPTPPRDVPNPPTDRPTPTDVPNGMDVPNAMDVPESMDIPSPTDVPNPRDVPNRDVPNAPDVPNGMDASLDV